MSTATKGMTAEELLALPDDGQRHELIRGELVTMAPGGGEHGELTFNVTMHLGHYIHRLGLGQGYGAETGYLLARDPDTVRAPDFSFIRAGRLGAVKRTQGFIPGCPDLAVEVVSPGDALEEVEEKVAMWLAAGTQEVWVIHPRRQTVSIHAGPTEVRILTLKDEIDGGTLLPGFRLPVAELFQ